MTTPNVTVLRDLVMIKPMPLALKKTADGIILPGDVDKMAPKRATVVAAGPGDYVKNNFVKNPFKVGDNILYMERGLTPVKINGEDYFMLKQEDIIVKLGTKDVGPNETIQELSDDEYNAETMRRKLIAKLKSLGLTRVQDMVNPTEIFITPDGESIPVTARSFRVTDEGLADYVAPEDAKAFTLLSMFFLGIPGDTYTVVRMAFLPRTDVTLG